MTSPRTGPFWGFEILESDADPLPGDPILFEGMLAGYVTSASFGFRIGKRLALGFLSQGLARPASDSKSISFGTPRPAICRKPTFYDAENRRLRS